MTISLTISRRVGGGGAEIPRDGLWGREGPGAATGRDHNGLPRRLEVGRGNGLSIAVECSDVGL